MIRRALPVALVALVAGTSLAVGAFAIDGSGAEDVLGPGEVTVVLDVKYSRFSPDRIRVHPGTTVRFVVDNRDPINHELIVGDAEVHRRHETGTEPAHAPRPGEVSVPATGQAETAFRFDEPGDVLYACHLPRHFAYGMRGVVEVRE